MREDYLHFLFKTKSLQNQFTTTQGEKMTILDFGQHNFNAGPDFLMAKIQLEETQWIGHIEFHLKSSDWFAHKHDKDRAYDNVIAHFVYEDDCEVFSGDYRLPTVELKELIQKDQFLNFDQKLSAQTKIPCEKQFPNLEEGWIEEQLGEYLRQRLERKSVEILKMLEECKGDRLQLLLKLLVRPFGAKVNGEAFLRLIEQMGPTQLRKIQGDIFKAEALLLGLSGLLPEDTDDPYLLEIKKEFSFMQKLWGLRPLNKVEWKSFRIRPSGLPPIRLAQLATVLSQSNNLSRILDLKGIDEIQRLFQVQPSAFWQEHYSFQKKTKAKSAQLSSAFVDLLMINCVVPFIYAMGKQLGQEQKQKDVLQFLENIKAEQNTIIRGWKQLGFKAKNAAQTQALIELKNELCNEKKCLFCTIGTEVLRE